MDWKTKETHHAFCYLSHDTATLDRVKDILELPGITHRGRIYAIGLLVPVYLLKDIDWNQLLARLETV